MRYRLNGSCTCALVHTMVLVLALTVDDAHAHDPGMSLLTLVEHQGEGSFQLVVADANLPEPRRASSPRCIAQGTVTLLLDARPLRAKATCRSDEAGHTTFAGHFTIERAGELSVAVPLLRELPRGHETFMRLLDAAGNTRAQRMIASADAHPIAALEPVRLRPAWPLRLLAVGLVALLVYAIDRVRRASFTAR